LTFGVGRSATKLPRFCQFVIPPASFVPGFSSQVTSVQFAGENPTRTANNVFDHIPAQTLQLEVSGAFDAGAGNTVGAGTTIECTGFFAPDPHIRPEWHLHEFSGDEHKGR
jgi:hypothetical protein